MQIPVLNGIAAFRCELYSGYIALNSKNRFRLSGVLLSELTPTSSLIVPGEEYLLLLSTIKFLFDSFPYQLARPATVELSRVGGVYGIRNLLATVSTSLNKFANSESSCVLSGV